MQMRRTSSVRKDNVGLREILADFAGFVNETQCRAFEAKERLTRLNAPNLDVIDPLPG